LNQHQEQKSFASFLQKRRLFFLERKKQRTFIFYCVLILITIAPFLAMRVPALGDTLNHVARMHILASIRSSPSLQRFYVVHWSAIPYLAMDAIVPWLARLIGIYAAAKIYVVACVLMPFAGILALQRAVRRHLGLTPAVGLLLGGNYVVALGFLNYELMAGLAIICFAGWVATVAWPRLPRLLLFTLASLLLYLGHAFGFLAYCCAVGGFEIARAIRTRFRPPRTVALDWVCAGAQALPVLLLALTLNTAAGTPGKLYSHWGDIGEKLLAFASPVLFLPDRTQIIVLIAGSLAAAVAARHVRLAPSIWPAALAAFLVALCVPEIFLSMWLTDFRLPLVALMLLLGSISFAPIPRLRPFLAVLLACLITVKSIDTWRVLQKADAQATEMQGLLTSLPRGAKLLAANESLDAPDEAELSGSTIWTMPLIAVIDRDALISYIFAGLTTVHARPEFSAISTQYGGPVTVQQLQDDLDGKPPNLSFFEQREGLKVYWHDWTNRFDYLLIEHFHAPLPATLPPHLQSVAQTTNLGLYRIIR